VVMVRAKEIIARAVKIRIMVLAKAKADLMMKAKVIMIRVKATSVVATAVFRTMSKEKARLMANVKVSTVMPRLGIRRMAKAREDLVTKDVLTKAKETLVMFMIITMLATGKKDWATMAKAVEELVSKGKVMPIGAVAREKGTEDLVTQAKAEEDLSSKEKATQVAAPIKQEV